jgi:peroxiredoxin
MKRFLLVIIFLPIIGFSQGVKINVQVIQSISGQAKLFRYQGVQTVLVDSSWQKGQGTYHFFLNEGYDRGLYKINVGKSINFNVVIAEEPIVDIKTVVYAPEDSLSSVNSIENQVYWKYQIEKRKTNQHTWLLRSLIDLYPDSSVFKQMLLGELYRKEVQLYAFARSIIKDNPNLLASKFIAIEQRPVAPPFIESDIVNNYLTASWWDDIDLNSISLVSSPEFSKYLWGFIELLYNEDFDKEKQDESFIKGIEKLMNLPMATKVKEYFRAQLIDGFSDSDYSEVIEYLKTNSFGELQAISSPMEYWKERGEAPMLRIGDKAFDFTLKGKNGKLQKLSKIKSKYKLIVFWSSWCPHCIESLPRIADIYNNYKSKGFEVIAICIDEDDQHYQAYISNLKLNWINLYEPNNGKSKIIHMYDVTETPKMFLLSEDLRIISKPSTRKQLESKLKQLLR